jgi:hypothetical protein
VTDIPEPWTAEWTRKRLAMIDYRRGPGFEVKPEYEMADGAMVHVHRPRVMEPASEGGHSLYAGQVCWDVVEGGRDLPVYLCEGDLRFLGA